MMTDPKRCPRKTLDLAHEFLCHVTRLVRMAKDAGGQCEVDPKEGHVSRPVVSDYDRISEVVEPVLRSNELDDIEGFKRLRESYPFETANMGDLGRGPQPTRYIAFNPEDRVSFEKSVSSFRSVLFNLVPDDSQAISTLPTELLDCLKRLLFLLETLVKHLKTEGGPTGESAMANWYAPGLEFVQNVKNIENLLFGVCQLSDRFLALSDLGMASVDAVQKWFVALDVEPLSRGVAYYNEAFGFFEEAIRSLRNEVSHITSEPLQKIDEPIPQLCKKQLIIDGASHEITELQYAVLRIFAIEKRAIGFSELARESGVSRPDKLLKALQRNYTALQIRLPTAIRKDGYYARVELLE
jgi:hypothetical protein